jgi:hypothetical protein
VEHERKRSENGDDGFVVDSDCFHGFHAHIREEAPITVFFLMRYQCFFFLIDLFCLNKARYCGGT